MAVLAATTTFVAGAASPAVAQSDTPGDTQLGDTQQTDTQGDTQTTDTRQRDARRDDTRQSDSQDDAEQVDLVDLSVGVVKVLDNVNILVAIQYAAGACALDANAVAVVVNQIATTGEATVCETRGQAVVINKV